VRPRLLDGLQLRILRLWQPEQLQAVGHITAFCIQFSCGIFDVISWDKCKWFWGPVCGASSGMTAKGFRDKQLTSSRKGELI